MVRRLSSGTPTTRNMKDLRIFLNRHAKVMRRVASLTLAAFALAVTMGCRQQTANFDGDYSERLAGGVVRGALELLAGR